LAGLSAVGARARSLRALSQIMQALVVTRQWYETGRCPDRRVGLKFVAKGHFVRHRDNHKRLL